MQDVVEPKDKVEEEVEYIFPEQHRAAFEGLTFLGQLTDKFKYKGHEFVIRTLTNGDLLRVFELAETYKGPLGQNKALTIGEVAAAVELVDGEPLLEALSDKGITEVSLLSKKFKIIEEWYPTVTDFLFNKLNDLHRQQMEVLKSLD